MNCIHQWNPSKTLPKNLCSKFSIARNCQFFSIYINNLIMRKIFDSSRKVKYKKSITISPKMCGINDVRQGFGTFKSARQV